MTYSPETSTAEFFIDGASMVSGFTGVQLQSDQIGPRFDWGHWGPGVGDYQLVELAIVPEPSSLALLALALSLIAAKLGISFLRRRLKLRRGKGVSTAQCMRLPRREALRQLQAEGRLTDAQAESYLQEVREERLAHEERLSAMNEF